MTGRVMVQTQLPLADVLIISAAVGLLVYGHFMAPTWAQNAVRAWLNRRTK